MKKSLLSVFLLLFFLPLLPAQAIPGEVLVQLHPGYSIEGMLPQIGRVAQTPVSLTRTLAKGWNMYKLSLDPEAVQGRELDLLAKIMQIKGVTAAQWDHYVEDRSVTPNDPKWPEQRDMNQIGLTRAWENSTGGLTQSGDTIVVAVLEKGLQKSHPDLVPNLWHNWGEVPDNNIDDDNNGYVDDYTGWDARSLDGSGEGNSSSHGTSVCGIVGARGNEGYGVTGVSWDVKILPIVNVALESEIIAAYYYVAELRQAYNASNGQRGAFVVATNASFGIDNAFASQYPLWCTVYDSLGKAGVINVAATSNNNIDVAEKGDMPTTCTSEFLMTVTNVDALTGRKVTSAGFSEQHIDMGSPGSGSYTTINRQIIQGDTIWHGSFGGTSAACPHTSGAIGLIYSVKCVGYVADALSNPAGCARRVRDAIFNNLREESTLEDITVYEGRLDVDLAIIDIMELCSGTVGDLAITDVRPNPVRERLQIRYQTPDYEERYSIRVFSSDGRLMYEDNFAPPEFEAKILTLDVKNWMAGMYFVQLLSGKDSIVKKVVKI